MGAVDDTPIFWSVADDLRRGRHHWRDDPPTEEIQVADPGEQLDTADHVATTGDPDLVDPIPDDVVLAEHHDFVTPYRGATAPREESTP